MSTTTVRVYASPKAIKLTITDDAYCQLSGSGRHYVAGRTKQGNPVIAVHSNVGSGTTFFGLIVDEETYSDFKQAIESEDYHELEAVIERHL